MIQSQRQRSDNNVALRRLYANIELTNKTTGEVKTSELYLGDYP